MLQAQVVDTPFSRTSPNYSTRASLAGVATRPPKTGLPPDRPSMDLSKTRSSGLITTGSDEFDAYIDQEAQAAARKGPKGSPTSALPLQTALSPPVGDAFFLQFHWPGRRLGLAQYWKAEPYRSRLQHTLCVATRLFYLVSRIIHIHQQTSEGGS